MPLLSPDTGEKLWPQREKGYGIPRNPPSLGWLATWVFSVEEIALLGIFAHTYKSNMEWREWGLWNEDRNPGQPIEPSAALFCTPSVGTVQFSLPRWPWGLNESGPVKWLVSTKYVKRAQQIQASSALWLLQAALPGQREPACSSSPGRCGSCLSELQYAQVTAMSSVNKQSCLVTFGGSLQGL